MATLPILMAMALVFILTMWTVRWWWHRQHPRGHVPQDLLLRASVVAGILAAGAGLLVLRQLARYQFPHKALPHVNQIKRSVVPEIKVPNSLARIRIVVNSGDHDIPAGAEDSCTDADIVHVTEHGNVECIALHSPAGYRLVGNPQEAQQQSFLAITAEGVAQDVAARKTWWSRYSEVIYFILIYFGVVLRIYWDIYAQKRRGRKPKISVASFVTAFVIAIVVYGVVVQAGMTETNKTLTFSGSVFAVYNGIVWPVLLNDLAALRSTAAPKI